MPPRESIDHRGETRQSLISHGNLVTQAELAVQL